MLTSLYYNATVRQQFLVVKIIKSETTEYVSGHSKGCFGSCSKTLIRQGKGLTRLVETLENAELPFKD